MVGNRSLAVMRSNFQYAATSTTATTTSAPTSHPAANARLEILPTASAWRKGHSSRGSVGERIQIIPGLKTSASFLTSLGHNLRLPDDDLLPSPMDTPTLRASYAFSDDLRAPSPFAVSATSNYDPQDVGGNQSDAETASRDGSLASTQIVTSDEEADTALQLIADSVARQRHSAAQILLLHPVNLALFVLVASLVLRRIYTPGHVTTALTTLVGLVTLALVAIRRLTSGYVLAAQEINRRWLGDDQILTSKIGDDVVGALVLSWEKGEGRGNRRRKWGKGVIRGWTVEEKYRGKGLGTELLDEAIRATERRGGEEVVFAEDHAHSIVCLPRLFMAPLVRKDARYRQQLEDMLCRGRVKR